MRFGTVKDENGDERELTNGNYRVFLESPKRSVRKNASESITPRTKPTRTVSPRRSVRRCLQDVYQARVRNHPSAREAALFADDVPVEVYDNLIDTIHEHLGTVHRYLDVRRKALKLKDLHFYDTYVPIVEMPRPNIPYKKAVDTVCDAFEPLGASYCKTLRGGLTGRWVDRYENQGKRSGAFSAGGYFGPPYILMNYQADGMDSMFTLAHEAGHSMHTYYSARNQPYQYYDYTIFVAEVASTFNEMLLFKHLFDKAKNDTMRAYLINKQIDDLRGTIVRQTMFAEFEKVIHALAEAGEPLTLERLRAEYRKLIEAYFGPRFTIDDMLELECLRIPHFYSAFYVYKYATGMSAAIALSRVVLEGGTKERDRYLAFLKSGGSKFPLELLRDAGVDMVKPEPVHVAMEHFGHLVDELESLL
jgi:oligoendopeptidase F